VIGEPFNFKGLVHQERKGLVISLSPKVLFDEDGTTIKEGGLPLLYETSDEIKAHFGLPIKVEAYCGDVSIATKQADAVACVLSDRLNTPRARIKTSGYKTPRERQRVDVIILNR
jgi:flagellar motor protein MotB